MVGNTKSLIFIVEDINRILLGRMTCILPLQSVIGDRRVPNGVHYENKNIYHLPHFIRRWKYGVDFWNLVLTVSYRRATVVCGLCGRLAIFKKFEEMLEESFESVNCVPDTNYIEYFHDAGIMGQTFVTFANKPTAESKFLYIYDLLKTHDRLPSILLNLHQKSNSKSRKLRDIGNVHFQNKLYSDALLEYNFSVMNAVVGSEDYALALANRSAAFYHLEKYDASICDIHLALATKYPKEKAYKLYEREVKCLGKLGRISQAKFKFKVSTLLYMIL